MLYVMLVGAYPFERPEDKHDNQKLQKMIQVGACCGCLQRDSALRVGAGFKLVQLHMLPSHMQTIAWVSCHVMTLCSPDFCCVPFLHFSGQQLDTC